MATLNLSITVPDAVASDVLNDFVYAYGYEDIVDGAPNPQTKVQFAKTVVISFMKNSIKRYRSEAEAERVRAEYIAAVDAISMS